MGLPPRLDFIAPAETIVPWSSLSVATDTINQPQPPRRRLRPYLNWLERSREKKKQKRRATEAGLRVEGTQAAAAPHQEGLPATAFRAGPGQLVRLRDRVRPGSGVELVVRGDLQGRTHAGFVA